MFVLLYGLLLLPWPGLNETYGCYFQALGRIVFGGIRGQRILQFEEAHDARLPIGTQITMANHEQVDVNGRGPVIILGLDTRGVGWVPTALIIALTLATPIPLRRRWWALFLGLLLVHGFILFSVGCYIWNESTSLGLLALTPFWKTVVDGLEETLVTQLGASFVVPVLIWLLVTFRRQDLTVLGSRFFSAPTSKEPD